MATSNGFTVTTERLDEAAAYIKDKTSLYDTDIKKLYEELEAMTSAQWKGVASETFRNKIEGYRGEFQQLKTTLDQFAEKLLVISKNYTGTENNITEAASNL